MNKTEDFGKQCNICASGMLFFAYLATFILIIVWLFKILHNAKNGPTNRSVILPMIL